MDTSVEPLEVQSLLKQGKEILILDVRDEHEWEMVNLGGISMPLNELFVRFQELDPGKEIFILCHSGRRSAQAAMFLLEKGFSLVRNIKGGLKRWAETVDSTLLRD